MAATTKEEPTPRLSCCIFCKHLIWQILLIYIDEFVVLLARLFFFASKIGTILLQYWIHGTIDVDPCLSGSYHAVRGKNVSVKWRSQDVKIISQIWGSFSSINPSLTEDRQGTVNVVASTGFSFSAAGLLVTYYVGVIHCLLQHGFITETTPLAGSSAGAIVSVAVAAEVPMHVLLKVCKLMIMDCRKNGTVFRLRDAVRVYLNKFLPEDAYLKASGRVRVAVTQLFKSPVGLLVENFSSREDLINAILASCFIPGYSAAMPFTSFRNTFCVDGGVTNFTPPTSAEKTVGVCAFQVHPIGLHDIEISPDLNPHSIVAPSTIASWAVFPQTEATLDRLFNMGYSNALVWVQKKLLESNSNRNLQKLDIQIHS